MQAFISKNRPRWGLSLRVGSTRRVLVLPFAFTDTDEREWYCVLHAAPDALETRVDPGNLLWIPGADVEAHEQTLDREAFDAVCRVLFDDDPRYPWIRLPEHMKRFLDGDPAADPLRPIEASREPHNEQEYPTIRQVLDAVS